jgi:N-acetylmuramoyl-L-alanine amidase
MKYQIGLLSFFFAVFITSTLNAQYIRYTKIKGKRYVYMKDVARYYGMQLIRKKKGCELQSKYSKIIFTYNTRKSIFNGINLTLSHSAIYNKLKQMPLLAEHDFTLFLDPMLRKSALPRKQIRTIMLDPGHGAKDTGAIGRRYKEKDITLKIALKLRAKLRKKGYKVLMTRSRDVFPSLLDRTEMCGKYKPDLFISIHCNSAGRNSKARGIETYSMTPVGEISTSDSKPSFKVEKGNKFDKNNSRLALEIQKNLLYYTKAKDRGIRHARFFVLKHASCPAVLIETGFLSDAFEESLLGASSYQDKIAGAIAVAIDAYSVSVK